MADGFSVVGISVVSVSVTSSSFETLSTLAESSSTVARSSLISGTVGSFSSSFSSTGETVGWPLLSSASTWKSRAVGLL